MAVCKNCKRPQSCSCQLDANGLCKNCRPKK